MEIIENQKLDEERALYGRSNLLVRRCSFDGPADGESALKECHEIEMEDCWKAATLLLQKSNID